MTSTTSDDGMGNGADASEALDPQGAEGIATILAMIAERSLDHRGDLDMDSASLDMLRSQEGREEFLREFVTVMMPDRVNPVIWARWLTGGATPFDRSKLTSPAPSGVAIGRAVERQSKSVARHVTGVQNAERGVAAAERRLEEARRELAIARSKDAAFIEYVVGEHLMSILAPMFAMGPAWTVMRAVSGHVPASAVAEEVSLIRDPKRRKEAEQAIRLERQEVTERILDVLDLWAGDYEFEHELREAIVGVVDRYSKRDRPQAQRRTRAAMRRTVGDPEVKRDREEVVDGMKRKSR
jgi:hypothetical protein